MLSFILYALLPFWQQTPLPHISFLGQQKPLPSKPSVLAQHFPLLSRIPDSQHFVYFPFGLFENFLPSFEQHVCIPFIIPALSQQTPLTRFSDVQHFPFLSLCRSPLQSIHFLPLTSHFLH